MARICLLCNCLASAKSGPRFKCCVRALQNSLEVLSCVQVSEWRAVFIKDSQEKVDFFILFPEQVENVFTISRLKVIKGGGDLQNKCVFVFSATQ